MSLQLFAVAPPGLEQVVANEVRSATGVPVHAEPGGAAFEGDVQALCRANLQLRVASRVLVRITRFHASEFHELERRARKVDWVRWVVPGVPLELRVTCRKSRLYHSDAVGQRLHDVISRQLGGAIPGEVEGTVPQLLVVRLEHDECVISADSSGAHLHRRGYRTAVTEAPLRETLAAALLSLSGWSRDPNSFVPLLDPFCGSGTVAIEGALIARAVPPGLASADRTPRAYAFQRWDWCDRQIWQDCIDAGGERILDSAPVPIVASDRDPDAMAAAVANAERAGVSADIVFHTATLSQAQVPAAHGHIVTNPPYGKRLGDARRLRDLYARLGQLCNSAFAGWCVTLLASELRLVEHTGLRFTELARSSNGGLPVRILQQCPPQELSASVTRT